LGAKAELCCERKAVKISEAVEGNVKRKGFSNTASQKNNGNRHFNARKIKRKLVGVGGRKKGSLKCDNRFWKIV